MSDNLVLEIIENHHEAFSVGTGDKLRYKQKMFMHCGGPFPIEAKLNINSPVEALPVGKYVLKPSAFQVGKWGDIEVNGWELRNNVTPAQPSHLKPLSKSVA